MTTFAIQTLNSISPEGIEILRSEGHSVDQTASPDGILVRSAKMQDMEIPDSVLAIARAGAGVNNIPVEACTERGIVVFNTPGANANSVKELVITGLLVSSRRIVDAIAWTRSIADSEDVAALVEKEKSRFVGPEILGKSLGVVGLGAIGVMVANAGVALGMRVIGFDPFISVESAWGLSREVRRANNLDAVLADSDYVSLHVPLNDDTRAMIGAKSLPRMRRGARLLNFARGGLVDSTAVLAALDSGALSAYVTDFPDSQVAGHPGVVPIPHLGASTPEAEDNCAVMAARQIRDYLRWGNIRNSVNFPDCALEFSGHPRLVIANRNIPNMVGQITTILAGEGINIMDLLNRHRGEVAYNIIDLDAEPSDAAVDALRAISGVIRVRVIPADA